MIRYGSRFDHIIFAPLLLGFLFLGASSHADSSSRKPQISVFTRTTPPNPEGVVVAQGQVYVSGPAIFGTAGKGPSRIFVYSIKNGQLLHKIIANGENLSYEHTFGGAAIDASGRLYVLAAAAFAPHSAELGIQRFTERNGSYVQTQYSEPFPNLPSCPTQARGRSCALPNAIAFSKDGSAYVSDSFQSVIWRVPPGGGAPEVWLLSPMLAPTKSVRVGANGLRFGPKRRHLYVVNTALASVFRIKFVRAPTQKDIQLFHQFREGSMPDDCAFGKSGRLYVGLKNEIAVLGDQGKEIARIKSSREVGTTVPPITGPANMAFDNKRESLLIANHQGNFAILRVFVGDVADPLIRPLEPNGPVEIPKRAHKR